MSNHDPGVGQPYGCGPRLRKDDGDGIDRTIPTGGTEQPKPTPNASDTAEEPVESD